MPSIGTINAEVRADTRQFTAAMSAARGEVLKWKGIDLDSVNLRNAAADIDHFNRLFPAIEKSAVATEHYGAAIHSVLRGAPGMREITRLWSFVGPVLGGVAAAATFAYLGITKLREAADGAKHAAEFIKTLGTDRGENLKAVNQQISKVTASIGGMKDRFTSISDNPLGRLLGFGGGMREEIEGLKQISNALIARGRFATEQLDVAARRLALEEALTKQAEYQEALAEAQARQDEIDARVRAQEAEQFKTITAQRASLQNQVNAGQADAISAVADLELDTAKRVAIERQAIEAEAHAHVAELRRQIEQTDDAASKRRLNDLIGLEDIRRKIANRRLDQELEADRQQRRNQILSSRDRLSLIEAGTGDAARFLYDQTHPREDDTGVKQLKEEKDQTDLLKDIRDNTADLDGVFIPTF